jgi:thymidylate synthase (FAD)
MIANLKIEQYNVLNAGYVRYIEHYGSDERVIDAARLSTGKGFLGWGPIDTGKPCTSCANGNAVSECPNRVVTKGHWCADGRIFKHGDERLLNYLWKNQHTSCFEQCGLSFEIQAPIFVIRQIFRHRTMRVNEHSGRYSKMPDTNYVPTVERCMLVDTQNNQANAEENSQILTEASAQEWLRELDIAYSICDNIYRSGLRRGIPKELARIIVPVARTTRARISVDLHNLLKFLKLRLHKTAQWETQEYSKAVGKFVAELFPRTWALFCSTYKVVP